MLKERSCSVIVLPGVGGPESLLDIVLQHEKNLGLANRVASIYNESQWEADETTQLLIAKMVCNL